MLPRPANPRELERSPGANWAVSMSSHVTVVHAKFFSRGSCAVG